MRWLGTDEGVESMATHGDIVSLSLGAVNVGALFRAHIPFSHLSHLAG